ncbi:hypothetical protein COCNU_09G000040 [Cocos nucifera]|uniref:Uncharacterized protein n=1 Tax=Cocos nucifera TaxID=13894 RepID=A0A8K0N7B6_COCNU|nr:hypothetical protein COCNU_09G000040 [Cocos nucifera]
MRLEQEDISLRPKSAMEHKSQELSSTDMTPKEAKMLARGLQAQKQKKQAPRELSKRMKAWGPSYATPTEEVSTPEAAVPLTSLSLPSEIGHQLMANSEIVKAEKAKASRATEEAQGHKTEIGHQLMANSEIVKAEKAKASRATEEAQGHKTEVSHLSTEVGYLQEALKREEQMSVDLRAALALEEERKKEVEMNFAKKKRRAMEEAISTFKSLEEFRDIKVAFTQRAFIKGYDLCQSRVVKKFPELELGFLSGEPSKDKTKFSSSKAAIPDAATDPAMSTSTIAKGATLADVAPSSSCPPTKVLDLYPLYLFLFISYVFKYF